MDNIKSFHKTVDNAGCLMETEEIPHAKSPFCCPYVVELWKVLWKTPAEIF